MLVPSSIEENCGKLRRKYSEIPAAAYSAAAQARSVVALIEELDLQNVVIAGYDIGSRIGQMVAADRPDLLRGLVIAPPLPAFYAKPQTIAELVDQSVGRALDLFGLSWSPVKRWGEDMGPIVGEDA